jgi:Zn-dependent peptidase ImmA (M78 family)
MKGLLKEFEARGIEVIFAPLPYCSGALYFKQGRWFCVIASQKPLTHQRFTLAHELYHFDHHQKMGNFFLDYSQSGWMEREANRGAAEYLMPDFLVPVAMEALKSQGNLSLEELARFFGVSRQAMRIRLEELGFWPLQGL